MSFNFWKFGTIVLFVFFLVGIGAFIGGKFGNNVRESEPKEVHPLLSQSNSDNISKATPIAQESLEQVNKPVAMLSPSSNVNFIPNIEEKPKESIPSESLAVNYINSIGKTAFKVKSFKKTNGINNPMGYKMEYEFELECLKRNIEELPSIPGIIRQHRCEQAGQTSKHEGYLYFENTENGWRVSIYRGVLG